MNTKTNPDIINVAVCIVLNHFQLLHVKIKAGRFCAVGKSCEGGIEDQSLLAEMENACPLCRESNAVGKRRSRSPSRIGSGVVDLKMVGP